MDDSTRLQGKSNKSWLWLLLLLILAGLIAYAFMKTPKDTTENTSERINSSEQQQVSPQTVDTTIRNISDLTSGVTTKSANGKRFELSNVQVTKVVGDTTFWINDNSKGNLFVELQNNLDAGSAEQQIKIQQGQMINLTGTVQQAPQVADIRTRYLLSEADALNINNVGSYLVAERVTQVQ